MSTKYLVVQNKAQLFALQNHEPGEMALCSDTNEIYCWDEKTGWSLINVEGKGLELNLYDLNKNIIEQLNPLTTNEVSMKMGLINEYYQKANNTYHMLLCRDFNYYTIFNYDSMLTFPDFAGAVCTIITELGDVYSIEIADNDSALEIWIRPEEQESALAFYLFPYDAGVVYYG